MRVILLQRITTIRSLQQTLKDQGFYYGTVTGDKSAETTAAIRRYQIRNGLQVTGELNEETLRSSIRVRIPLRRHRNRLQNLAAVQPNSVRSDASARLSQKLAAAVIQPTNRPLETQSTIFGKLFYQSAPLRVNAGSSAGAVPTDEPPGYYRGRVDGKYGSADGFLLRAFQSSAWTSPTDVWTSRAVQRAWVIRTDFAYLAASSSS